LSFTCVKIDNICASISTGQLLCQSCFTVSMYFPIDTESFRDSRSPCLVSQWLLQLCMAHNESTIHTWWIKFKL
jgi:hypothetical protein